MQVYNMESAEKYNNLLVLVCMSEHLINVLV